MKKIFHIYYLLGALIIFQSAFSQQVENDSLQGGQQKSFFKTVSGDVWHIMSSPFRSDRNDQLQFIAFTAINVGLFYTLDDAVDRNFVPKDQFDKDYHPGFWKSVEQVADFGDYYDKIGSQNILLGLTASFLTGGLLSHNPKHLQTARLLVESFFITQGITYGIKGVFGRSRPYTENGPTDFNFFSFGKQNDHQSMPSGHTSGAFAMMTVIAKQYNNWWIKYPAYLLATSVALQRIDERNHWMSDAVVGGALGYWVANGLVNYNQTKNHTISVIPFTRRNLVGLSVNFKIR